MVLLNYILVKFSPIYLLFLLLFLLLRKLNKKIFKMLYLLIFYIVLTIILVVGLSLIQTEKVEQRDNSLSVFEKIDSLPIYYSNNGEYVDICVENYNSLNKDIQNYFSSNAYILIIGNRESINQFIRSEPIINGKFSILDKYILVYTEDIYGNDRDINSFRYSVYHELGHFLDSVYRGYDLKLAIKWNYWCEKIDYLLNNLDISKLKNLSHSAEVGGFFPNYILNSSEYFAVEYGFYKVGKEIPNGILKYFNHIEGNSEDYRNSVSEGDRVDDYYGLMGID